MYDQKSGILNLKRITGYKQMRIEHVHDKRTYHIEDGDNKYEVIHVIKHPNTEYDDSYSFHIYREYYHPGMSGYWCFEPSPELENEIKEFIREYEHVG